MNLGQLSLRTAISEELLSHLRQGERIFAQGPRTHAIYDTTFHGCFRVEVDHGPVCRVAIEHVAGDRAFDWTMTEADRRWPSQNREREESWSSPPTQDEVSYRLDVLDADPAEGRLLLETVQALDWGEPTPESGAGRDGVVLFGSLTTEVGARTWTTWSPNPTVEPAKCVFFQRLLGFAIEHAAGSIRSELELVTL